MIRLQVNWPPQVNMDSPLIPSWTLDIHHGFITLRIIMHRITSMTKIYNYKPGKYQYIIIQCNHLFSSFCCKNVKRNWNLIDKKKIISIVLHNRSIVVSFFCLIRFFSILHNLNVRYCWLPKHLPNTEN